MNPGVDPQLLDRFVPLNALRAEFRARLARTAQIGERSAGEFLFRLGEPAKSAMFLLDGVIELIGETGSPARLISARDAAATHRLPHQSPRRVSALCATQVRYLAIDSALLDVMLTWEQQSQVVVGELNIEQLETEGDWMTELLKVPLFQRLPPPNLQGLFLSMKPVDMLAGETVVRQGDDGNYFYVITAGSCEVTRRTPVGGLLKLAELGPGDSFGEDALIANEPRNATVTMLSDGRLMRLSKAEFRELLKEPLTRRVTLWQARRLLSAGATRWLDVRLTTEFEAMHMPGSLNLPLHLLRMRMGTLDPAIRYIACCDTGRRSAVAAFLLARENFDVLLLDRGWEGAP